ncbi:DUF3025 domain-containing protein [Pseudoalteromonas fenneropenaei]|uniref:DUF3025 domain-containing protein n=1 Tax=Pseudoalteromonas fenneropenaei TaxID=1737459 RepID=A0ABV7CHH2_9GAMM
MKRFTPPADWQPNVLQSGAFAHLNQLFQLSHEQAWPSPAWLNQFLTAAVHSGQTAKFVANGELSDETRYYEAIIYETGQIPTREENWHDLFGALIWCLFPKTKALLNACHMADIAKHGLQSRTQHRNAITLFDECGVLVVTTDPTMIAKLQQHHWLDAFATSRPAWGVHCQAVIFGHANYEMLTAPFIGLTAKLLPVIVTDDYFNLDLMAQYQYLDSYLYQAISDSELLADNRAMSPLPLLGVPGWWEDNIDAAFYENTEYFRPKRTKSAAAQ